MACSVNVLENNNITVPVKSVDTWENVSKLLTGTVHTHTYTHTDTHTDTHKDTHAHTQIHMHTHRYTYTHTQAKHRLAKYHVHITYSISQKFGHIFPFLVSKRLTGTVCGTNVVRRIRIPNKTMGFLLSLACVLGWPQ